MFLLELAGAGESRRLATEAVWPQGPIPKVMVTLSSLEPTEQSPNVWKACPLCPKVQALARPHKVGRGGGVR